MKWLESILQKLLNVVRGQGQTSNPPPSYL